MGLMELVPPIEAGITKKYGIPCGCIALMEC
jgi:hypothetical protein